MSKFNPDFWEVTIDDEGWRGFSNQDHPFFEDPTELTERHQRDARARAMRSQLQAIMVEELTEPQRAVVVLTYFHGLNQRQISARLSISQQTVSQHLYGKARNGKTVGGAMRKLRKACRQQGIAWP
jgi:RNA polymerase sigma factor (sigma-70 family)